MTAIIIGGALSILWGVAHLIPTRNVVSGFGEISEDNKRIVTMEWVGEGLTLIFLGALVILVQLLAERSSVLLMVVNLAVAAMLVAMAVVSLCTGFKVRFVPYRLCPFIFSASALLICLGTLL